MSDDERDPEDEEEKGDYPLYGGTPPHEDPETSRDAAEEIRHIARTQRERVQRYVCEQGYTGATCDEVEIALDMPHQTTSARIRELAQLGGLVVTKLRRKTSHGRGAFVNVCPEFAPPEEPEEPAEPEGPLIQTPLL